MDIPRFLKKSDDEAYYKKVGHEEYDRLATITETVHNYSDRSSLMTTDYIKSPSKFGNLETVDEGVELSPFTKNDVEVD